MIKKVTKKPTVKTVRAPKPITGIVKNPKPKK
mgnify:CR=1 FL=1|jgi:hypothetical protein